MCTALGQVGQGLFHLVHQHQAEVAGLQARQGGVNGDEFATDFLHMLGAGGVGQAFAQQGHDFAIAASALGSVLVQDHIVKCGAQDHGLRADVLVAAVATLPSNPLTFPAIYYAAYRLGAWLLDSGHEAPIRSAHESMSALIAGASGPVLVGLIIFSIVSAILGFVLVHGAWRIALVQQWRRRRARH